MTISNSGEDERGRISGGKAGDQTGKEWRIRSWYSSPWNVILRHPDAETRELIAQMAEAAAKNDKIGYDQYQRETFWNELKKVGYKPEKITTACEADCSAGVAAIVKGAGYRLGDTKMQGVSPSSYTGNLRSRLRAAGFNEYTASKYLTSDGYLLRGDILLKEAGHTAINLTDGKYTKTSSKPATSSGKLEVDGIWGPATTSALQKILGTPVDGIVSGQDSSSLKKVNKGGLSTASWKTGRGGSTMIKAMQRKIGAEADGFFGPLSCKALQKYLGTYVDGYVDKPSNMVKALQKKLNNGKF